MNLKQSFFTAIDVHSCFLQVVTFTMFMQTDDETDDDAEDDMDAGEEKEKMRELISQKLKKEKGAEKTSAPTEEERGKKSSRRYDCMFLSDEDT